MTKTEYALATEIEQLRDGAVGLEKENVELRTVLREGVEGFSRIIVATFNQYAVYAWVAKGRALLAATEKKP